MYKIRGTSAIMFENRNFMAYMTGFILSFSGSDSGSFNEQSIK